jgi:carbon monoxide dehydrogenase subunit G
VQLSHYFTVRASKGSLLHALSDPRRVAACLPGAVVDSVTEEGITGRLTLRAGARVLAYRGSARLDDRDAPPGRIAVALAGGEGEGDGRLAATVRALLRADGAGTTVELVADLELTGSTTGVDDRLLADTVQRLLIEFSRCLVAEVAAPAAEPAAPEPALAVPEMPETAVPETAVPAPGPVQPRGVAADRRTWVAGAVSAGVVLVLARRHRRMT